MNEKFYLSMKQGSDEYLSPWKISRVIDELAEEYYKKYLLEIIVEKVSLLDDDEQIIIFDSSFDMYKKYSNLRDYSFEKREDVLEMYYLGNPISLKPNLKIKKMELLFELHRSLYTRLNAIDILMDRTKIIEYVNCNFNENEVLDLELLKQYLDQLLIQITKKKDEKEDNLYETVNKECITLISNAKVKFEEYVKDSVQLEVINSIDTEKELSEYLKDNDKLRKYKKYFTLFEATFNKLGRPIVGIINFRKQSLNILAKEFIREDLQNDNDKKLEMVNLSRNSPTLMGYLVGVIVVPWLGQLIITNLESKKIEKQQNLSNQEHDIDVNPEIEKLDKSIAEYRKMHEAVDNIGDKIINIEDFKIKKSLSEMDEQVVKNTKETLIKNDLLNESLHLELIKSQEEEEEEEVE